MIDWKTIDTAPQDGTPLLLFSTNGDSSSKSHPTRYWVGQRTMANHWWHPRMHSWNLDHDITDEIDADMKPTHWPRYLQFQKHHRSLIMKASELIGRLQNLVAIHGDLNVTMDTSLGYPVLVGTYDKNGRGENDDGFKGHKRIHIH